MIVKDSSGKVVYDGKNLITFNDNTAHWQVPFSWVNDLKLVNKQFLVATEINGPWLFSPKSNKSTRLKLDSTTKSIYHATFYNNFYYFFAKPGNYIYQWNNVRRIR